MTTTGQTITYYRGTTHPVTVPITDGGAPFTLTGSSVWWGLFANESDAWADALLTKKSTGGSPTITFVDVDGTADGVKFTLAASDIPTLALGNYYHECRILDGSTQYGLLFTGTFRLLASPTYGAS